MFIRSGQREDSGVYEVMVKVDSFEDKADFTLQIVGESCVWSSICLPDLADESDMLISCLWTLQLPLIANTFTSINILSKASNAGKTVYLLS